MSEMRTLDRRRPRSEARSAALGLLPALVLMTAACSSGAPAATTGAPSGSTQPSANAPSAAASSGSGSGQTTASACDSSDPTWQSVVAEAKKEGQVTFYIALAGFDAQVGKTWAEAYPDIKMTTDREPSSALETKVAAEKASGAEGADVLLLSDRGWFASNSGDITAPKSAIPAEYAANGSNFDGKFFTVAVAPAGLVINANAVATLGAHPIATYQDLLQPQLAGAIGIVNRGISPGNTVWYWLLQQSLGPQFLPGLAAQKPARYDSTAPLIQAVGSGELAVGFYANPNGVASVSATGAPVTFVWPSDPLLNARYYGGILSWTKRPAAAQVLMCWLLSPDGQQAIHGWGLTQSPAFNITQPTEDQDAKYLDNGKMTPELTQFGTFFDGLFPPSS